MLEGMKPRILRMQIEAGLYFQWDSLLAADLGGFGKTTRRPWRAVCCDMPSKGLHDSTGLGIVCKMFGLVCLGDLVDSGAR